MLDAHRDVAIPPETDFIPDLAEACKASAEPAQAFIDVLSGRWAWRLNDFQIGMDDAVRKVRELRPFTLAKALRIIYRTYAAKFGKERWGDKTPSYLGHMPLVARALPETHFIHVIRDGRDVWQSVRSLWFGPDDVEEAAAWWCNAILHGRRDGAQVANYLEIRFEDLVLEPDVVAQDVCAYLELEWDEAMLRYYERAPARIAEVITDYRVEGNLLATVAERHRIHELTAEPPDATRIGAWRRELPAVEAARFEAIAGGTLRELGYLD
jgi:hypothetical protein